MKKGILNIVRKCFKIFLNILIVIIGLFLLLSIYNFVNIKIMNKDYTNYFGYTFMNISSGSMEPTIKVKDYVIIKLNNKNYKKDDIVTFKSDNSIITHRIKTINKNTIITKGDANNTEDPPIQKKDIIGKVVHIGKSYGVILDVIKTPIVFISFFVTIILFDIALSSDNKEVIDSEKKKKE